MAWPPSYLRMREASVTKLAEPLLALAFVLTGSLVWDPQILSLRWPDGHQEQIAATSPATCEAAVRALGLGLWQPEPSSGPPSANCAPGSLFSERSQCIVGFNCRPGIR